MKATIRLEEKSFPGHKGRPGQVGGSLPEGGGSGAKASGKAGEPKKKSAAEQSLEDDIKFAKNHPILANITPGPEHATYYRDRLESYAKQGRINPANISSLMMEFHKKPVVDSSKLVAKNPAGAKEAKKYSARQQADMLNMFGDRDSISHSEAMRVSTTPSVDKMIKLNHVTDAASKYKLTVAGKAARDWLKNEYGDASGIAFR